MGISPHVGFSSCVAVFPQVLGLERFYIDPDGFLVLRGFTSILMVSSFSEVLRYPDGFLICGFR